MPDPRRPAFDHHHPPDAGLLDDCVHCGFCLPSCPTYQLWGEEMDSPRGRIHLMQQGLDDAPLSASMVQHFDRCLGCMACVTACPSGVQYDRLIEATRAQVERRHRRSIGPRALRAAIFAVFPYPARLRRLRLPLLAYQRSGLSPVLDRLGILRRLPRSLQTMESLPPRVVAPEPIPEHLAAQGPKRGTVGLLTGCVQSVFFPQVNAATARVLAAEGFEVVTPPGQGCCGALSVHAGRRPQARRLARSLIDTFWARDVDFVVVNAAGCGSTMKEYADLLADDPRYAGLARSLARRTRDVAEFLVEAGPVATRHPLPVTVAYHDACHLAHAQGIRARPRALLAAIPGVQLREIEEGELCCGSAGVYNLLEPEAAAQLGDRKADRVLATGAELLVTANPGCLLQVAAALGRRGATMAMTHTVQMLDASIRDLGAVSLTSPSPGG